MQSNDISKEKITFIIIWISYAAPQQYKKSKLCGFIFLYCLRFAVTLDKLCGTSTIQKIKTLWFYFFVLSSVCCNFALIFEDYNIKHDEDIL